jgi:hypothetical protein
MKYRKILSKVIKTAKILHHIIHSNNKIKMMWNSIRSGIGGVILHMIKLRFSTQIRNTIKVLLRKNFNK